MRTLTGLASGKKTLKIAILVCSLLAVSILANAQTGQNAVYNSSGTCSPICATSAAFIDATVFVSSPPPLNRDFCGVLNYVLVPGAPGLSSEKVFGVPRSLRFLQGAGPLVEYGCEENVLAAVNASL